MTRITLFTVFNVAMAIVASCDAKSVASHPRRGVRSLTRRTTGTSPERTTIFAVEEEGEDAVTKVDALLSPSHTPLVAATTSSASVAQDVGKKEKVEKSKSKDGSKKGKKHSRKHSRDHSGKKDKKGKKAKHNSSISGNVDEDVTAAGVVGEQEALDEAFMTDELLPFDRTAKKKKEEDDSDDKEKGSTGDNYDLDDEEDANRPSRIPTRRPTLLPTRLPTFAPSFNPTISPSFLPTGGPTFTPTHAPTLAPTSGPTDEPSSEPTSEPTHEPTAEPTNKPTREPSNEPTLIPSNEPTIEPTNEPTNKPSPQPTDGPSSLPTDEPTSDPTDEPTSEPTSDPTDKPTNEPTQLTSEPTRNPSPKSSNVPTDKPLNEITEAPTTDRPTVQTRRPTLFPSEAPTNQPNSTSPTGFPTATASARPSAVPSVVSSSVPSVAPSVAPSVLPSIVLSVLPSTVPSVLPSIVPSALPSTAPSTVPSFLPSAVASVLPSTLPSLMPTTIPSVPPSSSPPSVVPTAKAPSSIPSIAPVSEAPAASEVELLVTTDVGGSPLSTCNSEASESIVASVATPSPTPTSVPFIVSTPVTFSYALVATEPLDDAALQEIITAIDRSVQSTVATEKLTCSIPNARGRFLLKQDARVSALRRKLQPNPPALGVSGLPAPTVNDETCTPEAASSDGNCYIIDTGITVFYDGNATNGALDSLETEEEFLQLIREILNSNSFNSVDDRISGITFRPTRAPTEPPSVTPTTAPSSSDQSRGAAIGAEDFTDTGSEETVFPIYGAIMLGVGVGAAIVAAALLIRYRRPGRSYREHVEEKREIYEFEDNDDDLDDDLSSSLNDSLTVGTNGSTKYSTLSPDRLKRPVVLNESDEMSLQPRILPKGGLGTVQEEMAAAAGSEVSLAGPDAAAGGESVASGMIEHGGVEFISTLEAPDDESRALAEAAAAKAVGSVPSSPPKLSPDRLQREYVAPDTVDL